jgi:hypothetical protein
MLRILQINCLAGVTVMHCFLEVWRSASLAGVFRAWALPWWACALRQPAR